MMKFTLLGCGASGGVPLVNGMWGGCDPKNVKNYRTRTSLLVQSNKTNMVIDTTPDFRAHMLRERVSMVDAVLYTHAHADHCHGIDDLRPYRFVQGAPINIYGDQFTMDDLENRFNYLFHDPKNDSVNLYPAVVNPHVIQGSSFTVNGDIPVRCFVQDHKYMNTLGYRIGAVGYSTDVNKLDESAFEILEGIDIWFVDCIKVESHHTHSYLEQTLSWIDRVKPKRAILIHMDFTMDFDEISKILPAGVEPGYDGLAVEI